MKRSLAQIVTASALMALASDTHFAQQRQLTPEQQAQQEATRQDHRRMLEALKITSLRPGGEFHNRRSNRNKRRSQ